MHYLKFCFLAVCVFLEVSKPLHAFWDEKDKRFERSNIFIRVIEEPEVVSRMIQQYCTQLGFKVFLSTDGNGGLGNGRENKS